MKKQGEKEDGTSSSLPSRRGSSSLTSRRSSTTLGRARRHASTSSSLGRSAARLALPPPCLTLRLRAAARRGAVPPRLATHLQQLAVPRNPRLVVGLLEQRQTQDMEGGRLHAPSGKSSRNHPRQVCRRWSALPGPQARGEQTLLLLSRLREVVMAPSLLPPPRDPPATRCLPSSSHLRASSSASFASIRCLARPPALRLPRFTASRGLLLRVRLDSPPREASSSSVVLRSWSSRPPRSCSPRRGAA
nr:unnamed protein product [Digitaria exilis]